MKPRREQPEIEPVALVAPEAEAAVIGVLLIAPKAWEKIGTLLESKDFFDETQREVFKASSRLSAKGLPVDGVTLLRELKLIPFTGVGSWAHELAQAAVRVPTTAHLDGYIAQVKEASMRRKLVRLCERARSALLEGMDVKEAWERMSKAMSKVLETEKKA